MYGRGPLRTDPPVPTPPIVLLLVGAADDLLTKGLSLLGVF